MRRPITEGHVEIARFRRALRCLLCALLLLSGSARAQVPGKQSYCTDSDQRYVVMKLHETAAAAPVAFADVVKHVGSELRLRQVELCTTPKRSRALGELRIEVVPPTSLRISLWAEELHESLGERALDLEPIPSDARLLAIAVAADELVATNLRELERRAQVAAERAIAPRPLPPRPVAREARGPSFELGPGFVYEAFDGGQTLLGFDARFGVRLAGPLALTLRAGFRQGLPKPADHGSLHATALLGGLGLRLRLVSGRRVELALLARLDAMRLSATAYPSPGATAHADDGTAVLFGAGPALRVALSRSVGLMLEGTAGSALRPVHITDDGRRVSGVSGLALALGGGVLVAF